VGKSEGAQIIQLFGRGVRLKGYEWSLKRSGHSSAPSTPKHIGDIETRMSLGSKRISWSVPPVPERRGAAGKREANHHHRSLNVTYDFGKKLMVIRPKRKRRPGV
jgi:hypothetical protein